MSLHCPAGHGPFEAWAEWCPECGALLVGREPIVHLATAPNEIVAQLWRQELERAGIRTLAKNLGPGFGGFGTTLPLEHAVYVRAPDLERARALIAGSGAPRRRVRRHPPTVGGGPRRPTRAQPPNR